MRSVDLAIELNWGQHQAAGEAAPYCTQHHLLAGLAVQRVVAPIFLGVGVHRRGVLSPRILTMRCAALPLSPCATSVSACPPGLFSLTRSRLPPGRRRYSSSSRMDPPTVQHGWRAVESSSDARPGSTAKVYFNRSVGHSSSSSTAAAAAAEPERNLAAVDYDEVDTMYYIVLLYAAVAVWTMHDVLPLQCCSRLCSEPCPVAARLPPLAGGDRSETGVSTFEKPDELKTAQERHRVCTYWQLLLCSSSATYPK